MRKNTNRHLLKKMGIKKHQIKKISLTLVALLSIACCFCQNNHFYEVKFKDIQHKVLKMSEFKGKKIIIAVMDAARPHGKSLQLLLTLDTIYKVNKAKMVVIAIPMVDNGNIMKEGDMQKFLQAILHISYPIAECSKIKKKNGNNQHSLFKWLTDKTYNKHFDKDADQGGQLFIINESGELYAELNTQSRSTNANELKKILNLQSVK